jgi:hypothetical protein
MSDQRPLLYKHEGGKEKEGKRRRNKMRKIKKKSGKRRRKTFVVCAVVHSAEVRE